MLPKFVFIFISISVYEIKSYVVYTNNDADIHMKMVHTKHRIVKISVFLLNRILCWTLWCMRYLQNSTTFLRKFRARWISKIFKKVKIMQLDRVRSENQKHMWTTENKWVVWLLQLIEKNNFPCNFVIFQAFLDSLLNSFVFLYFHRDFVYKISKCTVFFLYTFEVGLVLVIFYTKSIWKYKKTK